MKGEGSHIQSGKGRYRYPGAQPFRTDQRHLFFGREKDITDLFQLISVEQLSVLYSKSGLGKSSLLNAGIIPMIEEEENYHPISIRLGAYTEIKKDTPVEICRSLIAKKNPQNPVLDKVLLKENSLWYHLKNRRSLSESKKGFILIFDQFEEVFTYPEGNYSRTKLKSGFRLKKENS